VTKIEEMRMNMNRVVRLRLFPPPPLPPPPPEDREANHEPIEERPYGEGEEEEDFFKKFLKKVRWSYNPLKGYQDRDF
jgi:hypothetical protein